MALDKIESIVKTDNNALVINHKQIGPGDEVWYLLTSDNHADSTEVDTALEMKHLDQAIERDAGIINLGDLHDAMQGKNDSRGSKAKVRRELMSRAYWDSLTDFMVERYGHVADRWVAQGYGNHETSVLNRNEVDLIQRFAAMMNCSHNGVMNVLGYSGFIRFNFKTTKTTQRSVTMFFTHGHGGGGKATQGLPGMMRLNHNIAGTDIMACGHTHNSYCMDYVKTEMSQAGKIVEKHCHVVQLPTYKDGWDNGAMGWEAEKGIGGKPRGAWWLRMFYVSRRDPIGIEFTRAT